MDTPPRKQLPYYQNSIPILLEICFIFFHVSIFITLIDVKNLVREQKSDSFNTFVHKDLLCDCWKRQQKKCRIFTKSPSTLLSFDINFKMISLLFLGFRVSFVSQDQKSPFLGSVFSSQKTFMPWGYS